MRPYQVSGVWYTPRSQPDYDETGTASWYGAQFHNRSTSNGERFDMEAVSAAHTTLPLPSIVEVTNLDNGRRIRVRVNDRGPFVRGRIIDLSRAAAQELGFYQQGTARVRVRYVGPAPPLGGSDVRLAQASRRRDRDDDGDAALPNGPQPYRQDPRASYRTVSAASPPAPARGLRVQAGAFSTQDNAERAARQLASAGPTRVEPMERDGRTLYRVTVGGGEDADTADGLRARVAAAGYPDARVIGF